MRVPRGGRGGRGCTSIEHVHAAIPDSITIRRDLSSIATTHLEPVSKTKDGVDPAIPVRPRVLPRYRLGSVRDAAPSMTISLSLSLAHWLTH